MATQPHQSLKTKALYLTQKLESILGIGNNKQYPSSIQIKAALVVADADKVDPFVEILEQKFNRTTTDYKNKSDPSSEHINGMRMHASSEISLTRSSTDSAPI